MNERVLDRYRVRPVEDMAFVMEHKDGQVEVYARLTGWGAKERAEKIAKDANEGET